MKTELWTLVVIRDFEHFSQSY